MSASLEIDKSWFMLFLRRLASCRIGKTFENGIKSLTLVLAQAELIFLRKSNYSTHCTFVSENICNKLRNQIKIVGNSEERKGIACTWRFDLAARTIDAESLCKHLVSNLFIIGKATNAPIVQYLCFISTHLHSLLLRPDYQQLSIVIYRQHKFNSPCFR